MSLPILIVIAVSYLSLWVLKRLLAAHLVLLIIMQKYDALTI